MGEGLLGHRGHRVPVQRQQRQRGRRLERRGRQHPDQVESQVKDLQKNNMTSIKIESPQCQC